MFLYVKLSALISVALLWYITEALTSLFCTSWFALFGCWPKRHCHTELILILSGLETKHFLLCARINHQAKTFALWYLYGSTFEVYSTRSGFLNFCFSIWSSQSWYFGSILDINRFCMRVCPTVFNNGWDPNTKELLQSHSCTESLETYPIKQSRANIIHWH